jgi:ankyrin repeat protein
MTDASARTGTGDPRAAFIEAACVPLDDWHASGTLERAEAILAENPEVATGDIHAAAILGDDATVRRFLCLDAGNATAKGGPRGWDALTHLCFSRYLRLDRARSGGFLRSAEALLDAGASPSTGFHSEEHQPKPAFESVLYGAAGIAHDADLTRLLLDRGADPNDGETEYHTPEGFDNAAMKVVVESGKLAPMGLLTMLVRKLDWTDYDGAAWLLAHGADPNGTSHWGRGALHHALGRDNPLLFFELLVDHGADPRLPAKDGSSAFAIAARAGRADVLDLFESRGFAGKLEGDDAFLAACARADEARAREFASRDPAIVRRLQAQDSAPLVYFAGAGNTAAVRLLLDLGFDIASRAGGGLARGATALHVAVWRERQATVKLLLERGAPQEATNASGETPLSLAARALVEHSEWTPHGSAEIVAALLAAGARAESVKRFPTGSAEADDLLRRHGRSA